jgi:hypothetical protein
MAAVRVTNGEEQRAEALLEMGFNTTQAALLAATQAEGHHVDLDELRSMLEAGCEHELALRIVL